MAPRALHLGALVALTAAAIATAPAALGQPSPDAAPVPPALAPDPAPEAAPPPAPAEPTPAQPAPAAPAPAEAAPLAPAVEQPPSPAAETPVDAPREQRKPRRRADEAKTPKAVDTEPVPRAAFLQVESLLPRADTDDNNPNTMLLLAAGALMALVMASGSFTSMLARLMPPTAVVVLLVLAAPAPASAGTITPNCDTPGGARDTCSHWYTSSKVSLTWTVEPTGGEHVLGCQVGSFTAETAPLYRECKWSWSGSVFTATIWIGIDRTAPQLTSLQLGRAPDYNGWFNHPVALKFKGSDALSGVKQCSETTYSGPDGAGASVPGTCTDVAGNTGSGSLPINYDATPPAAPAVVAKPRNGAVRLEWTPAPDSQAEVARVRAEESTVVYRGSGDGFTDGHLENEERYRYVVTLVDQAGNRASGSATTVPTASPLLTPSAHARLAEPPLLTWRKVRRASYYNVQLFRGHRKVLTRWPRSNELQLKRRWTFAGERRRLVAGRYCWYVWPGFGPRRQRDYGRLLGKRCFTVTR